MHLHRPRTATPTGLAPDSTGTFASFIAVLAMIVSLWTGRAEASVNAQDGDGWVTREVKGVGASLVQAKADAIRAALRQVVGEFVRSEVVVEGEAVDEFLIAFSSPEQVRSEQIGSPSLRSDGMIAVQMRVSVMARSLVRAFEMHATRSGGRVTRTATAAAPSLQAARAAAISDALRAIVGEFVEAKLTSDGVIVEEVIRSFSAGDSVQSEQVGEAALTPSGEVEVTMRISLMPQELIDMFAEQAQGDILLDAENLAAEIAVARSSIQAQRALMQRLFTDLPIRLLVARLIDREGRPIVDGRPDHRDIRPLDDGSVAIAFNIEIYFDLPSYYNKVLPNLVTALRAVSSEEQRMEVSFWRQKAGPLLFDGPQEEASRQLWGSGNASYTWPQNFFWDLNRNTSLSPQERVVALSIGRNRDGSVEQWGLWRCHDWVAETIHTAASSVLKTNLALFLLDEDRRVVAGSVHPLTHLEPLLAAGPNRSDGGIRLATKTLVRGGTAGSFRLEWNSGVSHPLQFFEINGVYPFRYVQPWFRSESDLTATPQWDQRVTFSGPRFCARIGAYSREVIDILPVRVALILPQTTFERVRSIAFDFFTEEHCAAPASGRVPSTPRP